jgi:hypothetical protein
MRSKTEDELAFTEIPVIKLYNRVFPDFEMLQPYTIYFLLTLWNIGSFSSFCTHICLITSVFQSDVRQAAVKEQVLE